MTTYSAPVTVLAIQLLPPAMEARLRPSQGTFGLAFGSTAYIFCGRLDRLAQNGVVSDRSRLLGNLLAHEIIHLLLGPGSHAQGGIMRPRWRASELLQVDQGALTLLSRQIDRLRCTSPSNDSR